jgi:hypothetical protein
MIYAHSLQEKAYEYFASFIRNVLNGDDRYKPLVEPILQDVQSLVKKDKDYFNINRNNFDVTVLLAERAPEFFEKLDLKHVSDADYKRILDIVTQQRDLILA